jgi:hypothetical protein
MIIKLRASPLFNGEYYKTKFVDGVSQEHVNQYTFDLIRDVLGMEPYVIQPDFTPDCLECKKKDIVIKMLTEQLDSKKKKKK